MSRLIRLPRLQGMMLKRIAHARIHRLERAMDYDMTYVHEIVDAGGYEALAPLAALAKLSAYRRDVPIDVYYGAKITSVMAADCGPCAQLVASMAERDGVSPEVLRALVAGDREALSHDVQLGVDLASAALIGADDGAVREEIVARWGQRALISLAYAIVAAQAYPTLKYALGYGKACTKVRVAGTEVAPHALVPA